MFNGRIDYTGPDGSSRRIDSLFETYIRRVTSELQAPWLLSVFRDNAGVIRFNERLALVYKVETHNSPSALDPYGDNDLVRLGSSLTDKNGEPEIFSWRATPSRRAIRSWRRVTCSMPSITFVS